MPLEGLAGAALDAPDFSPLLAESLLLESFEAELSVAAPLAAPSELPPETSLLAVALPFAPALPPLLRKSVTYQPEPLS